MATDVIIDPSTGQIYWNDSAGVGTESISIKGDAVNTISFTGYSGSFSPGSTPAGALTLVTIKDTAGTDALIPGTTGYNLGSSTLRWNTFATNANLSGTLVVSDSTNSSSLITGSAKINGGIAISGNAFIGGTINVASPITIPNGGTNASSFGQSAGFVYYDGENIRLLAATGASINYSNGYYQFNNRVYATSFYANNAQMPNGSGIAGRVTIWSGNNTIGSDAEFTYDTTNNILNVSGNINAIGFTASGIAITSVTASTSTTSGALVVAGGVGISGKLTFNQAAFGTTGITTVPTMAMIGQTGDPIYMSVLEDNSISFEGSQGQLFSISPNLTTGYIWSVNDISGVPLLRSSVGGTIGIAEFGGIVGIGQTNPIYKLDLKGSFGLASSNDSLYNFIFSNSAASGSNSLQIRSANSLLLYNSGNSFYTGFKSNAATNITYTLPTTDGSADQFLQTNGSGVLTWATATGSGGTGSTAGVGQGGQYEMAYYPGTGLSVIGSNTFTNNTATGVVSITHATVATDSSTGALKVTGGVGIGGSLYVGGIGASITGVTFSNSTITRGTWNGTNISTTYGGTGQNLGSSSGVLTISSGTVSASTTSSAILSAITDETGSGVLVFNTQPSFGTGVTTGSATFAVFNTNATAINAFGAATAISLGAATGKATFNSTDNSISSTTGGLVVSGGAGFAKSISIAGYLQLLNGANVTAFVSSGTGNTVYTLPATSPATGSSVLQSTAEGVMSWVPMVASSSSAGSGTVAIPGAQYQIAAYYSGTGASVSGSATFTNSTAASQVAITHNTASTSTNSGALVLSGGLGLAGNAFIGGTISVPSTSTSNISNILFTNGVINSGTWAATAITAHYGGTGLQTPFVVGDILYATTTTAWGRLAASSTSGQVLTSNGAGNLPTWQAVPPAAASSVAVTPTVVNASFFIPVVNSASSSAIGLSTVSTLVINPSNGLVTVSGLAVTNLTNSSSKFTGAITVSGGLGVTGNAFIGGTINVESTSTSVISGVSFANGVVTVGSWNGTAIAPQYGGTGQNYSASSGILKYTTGAASLVTAPSGAIVGTTDSQNLTNKTYNNVTVTAPATNATFTIADTTTFTTSGAFNLTLTTTALTNVTLPSGNKTLAATDVATLSNLISVGTISTGGWSATAITSHYGGTGLQSPFVVGDILYATTTTAWGRLAASSTSGQVLTSNGAGNLPTWQAVPPAAASSVAVTPTAVNASFFIPVVNSASSSAIGLSTVSTLVINPSTNVVTLSGLAVTAVTQTTNATSGALVVTNGAAVGQTLSVGGSLNIFNGANYTGFRFSGSASTTYTLPIRTPTGTGTSYLSSSVDGVMAWVAAPTSGGSGAVNSGTATFAAFYASTSNAVSENANLQFTGTGVSIGGSINSSSTTTGSMYVFGGLGISGNAFIGGTVNISSTTPSNIANLLVSSNLSAAGGTFTTLLQAANIRALSGNTISFQSIDGTNSAQFNNVRFAILYNTVSTSSGTGGLVVSGGAGIGGSLFVASASQFESSAASIGVGSGAVVVTGGVGIGGSLYVGGASRFSSSTTSISIGTGALTVTGGAGIAGSLYVGEASRFTSTTVSLGSGTGALTVTGGVGIGGSLYVANTSRFESSTISSSVGTGALSVTGGVGIGGSLFVGDSSRFTSSNISISSGTGALTVTGGVGIGGSLYVANTSRFESSVISSSVGTGALVVAGGVGIGGSLFVGNSSRFSSTNISSSSGTGALTVTGGVGIGGSLYVGDASRFESNINSTTPGVGGLIATGGVGIGLSVSIGGRLQLFNGANYTAFVSSATGATVYILPPRTPTGTGTSYLSSSVDGVMAWVAAPTSGGSATPGGSNKQIQYNNSNAFGGASGFEFTTGGIANTVSIFSASGTGYTAGLWIHAINGSTTRVGIGLSNPAFELEILGEISATNKSFVIDHPTKQGMKLRYGSLEGPENGVYVRGELKGTNIIEVPDHWIGLVHEDSYTVHLTPIGRFSQLYVEKIENYNVFVADTMMCPIHCYYSVWAERKDIPKLITEYEAQ